MLSYQQAACEIARHICTDNSHGYSQPNRAGIGTGGGVGETITLSDGTKVGISSGDRDCSSMSIESYAAMGINCGGATYTGNMRRCMTASGNFAWHGRGDLGALQPGDLLLKESSHTAVYLGSNQIANASSSEHGSTHGSVGDQTGREVLVRSYYDPGWDGFLRYIGHSRAGQTTTSSNTAQDGDEMVCIIQPNDENILMYFDGHDFHDLAHPDDVKALDMVYQQTHGGAHIPSFKMGKTNAPWATRLYQAVYGGCPTEAVAPSLNDFAPRSPREVH